MYKTDNKSLWRAFREHHYLSHDLNNAADCYIIVLKNVIVGFLAVLSMPSGVFKYGVRITRCVILPDYQNLNFGTKFQEFIGQYYINNGYKYHLRTSHIRLKNHCQKSKLWKICANSGKIPSDLRKSIEKGTTKIAFGIRDHDLQRIAYSFEYFGIDYSTKKHLELCIEDTKNINYVVLKNDLKNLKQNYWLRIYTGQINTTNEIEKICCELGIRTDLLHLTQFKKIKYNKNVDENYIFTKWDENILNNVYENVDIKNIDKKYFDKNVISDNLNKTLFVYNTKKNILW